MLAFRLDDVELISVLADTKAKATEVTEKLSVAAETKIAINEKREQYRPVATRGSVLYFAVVDMAAINCMYQTSLSQFLGCFLRSMDVSVERVREGFYAVSYFLVTCTGCRKVVTGVQAGQQHH